eukprot:6462019-Amphidinium_carterae.2
MKHLPGVFGWLRLQHRPRSQPADFHLFLHYHPSPLEGAMVVHSYLSGHPCPWAPPYQYDWQMDQWEPV